jgi:hypothetical protein
LVRLCQLGGGANSATSDTSGCWSGCDFIVCAARDAAGVYVADALASGQLRAGRIALEPRWRQDYTALVQRVLEDGAEPSTEAAEEVGQELPPIVFARLPAVWSDREADALFVAMRQAALETPGDPDKD